MRSVLISSRPKKRWPSLDDVWSVNRRVIPRYRHVTIRLFILVDLEKVLLDIVDERDDIRGTNDGLQFQQNSTFFTH